MRISIITVDSRGDTQPCVALGLGLHAAGHSVRLVAHPEHANLIPPGTLDFYPLVNNPRAAMHNRAGGSPALFMRRLLQSYAGLMCRFMADCLTACNDADVILFSASGFFARSVAEKRKVPFVPIFLQPLSPTSAFPHALFGAGLRLGGVYNRLTYSIADGVSRQIWRSSINQARREVLDLPPIPALGGPAPLHRHGQPFLYGFSTAVVPRPPDWGPWLHVTGYWFLDHAARWQPPAVLADFLAAGPPPVYVGFGSMNKDDRQPDQLLHTVVTALRRSGQRGILCGEWSNRGSAIATLGRDQFFAIDSVPHDWLFPRLAAAVHHGGAGTTAAALRAGIPSVIVPYFADQPFWGRQAFDLGVAPRPIPRKLLSVERLTHAITHAVDDSRMAARATELGAAIRAEDGVARAIDAFHRYWP